jgi:aryl-alcohol dehydrogenase-like predicted oxidoreductase
MEYRTLQNTDLSLSVITFGAWAAGGWMWGSTDRNEAIDAIKKSYEVGVTSIDTAAIYGQGESEEIVRDAIKGISRDKVQILTKFGMRWDLAKGTLAFNSKNNKGEPIDIYRYAGKESVIEECENSLRRLCTDYIDLYQIHWHDVITPISETFEAVEKLLQQGKIRYAGVCNYRPEWLAEAQKKVNIVSDQIPFSMVNRAVEKDTIPYCIEHSKSVLAYSPLERGLLTGKMGADYKFAEGDHRATHPSFTPENIKRTNIMLEHLKPLALEKGITLSQLVLRWTVQRPGVTIALAGARNAEQALQNAKAGEFVLSKEEMDFIDRIVTNF